MEITSAVDLIVFAGQSNMAGRGDAEDAPECLPGAGYEYKAVSAPEDLIPIQEPFGLHEDRANGLSDRTEDGGTKRSGSMVTALVNEYYRQTGHVVIGVSELLQSSGRNPIFPMQSAAWRAPSAIFPTIRLRYGTSM